MPPSTKHRRLLLAGALAPLVVFTAGLARADAPSLLSPTGEPLVWADNCARDGLHSQEMACLSRSLVPQSQADAITRRHAARRALHPFNLPPDAGAGVDASVDIVPCDGRAVPHGAGTSASGWTPANYVKAYSIPTTPTGTGKVVAIVDACAETSIIADLVAYRKNFTLPALPTCGGAVGHAPTPGAAPCFGVVSQRGGADLPPSDSDWAGEIALDVDMVSTACPECSILLVEADSPNSWDLGPAVDEAVTLGASAVSNSYGATEDANDPFGPAYSDAAFAQYYEHPGVLIAAASGDSDYDNETSSPPAGFPMVYAPSFPATIPTVLAVGGTSLAAGAGTARGGFTETLWGGTTSGCSGEFPRPAYQSTLDMGSCTMRGNVDVSASAAGVAVYIGGGWQPENGTSCASPFVAGLFTRLGLANQANDFVYAHPSAFYDVTSGNDDPDHKCTDVMCNAGTGWDGPTGWGSPNGIALAALVASDGGPDLDAGDAGDATTEEDASDGGSSSGGGSGSGSGGGSGSGSGSGSGGGGSSSSGGTTGASDAGSGGGGAPTSGGCSSVAWGSGSAGSAGFALFALASLVAARRRRRG